MQIGIDCQSLGAGVRHGYATYLGNLLAALRARYARHEFVGWSCRAGPGWRLPHQLWWDQVRVPWQAVRSKVDLIHSPAFSGPILRPVPLVMTVMDVMYTRYPAWLPTSRARWYWGRWIPFTARRATAVIAPSEATKQDLVALAGIPPERVAVIPLAVDPLFLRIPPQNQVQAYRSQHGLSGPYVLYVGSIDRRKDLGGLLRAYARVRARVKGVRLVIAGHLIQGRSTLREDLEATGLTRDVWLPGLVPDKELTLLYAGASLFAYPSWWEGFGLPPLEAMAMGVPVITYRAASLPEVVGDAAILIDPPFTEDALAHAMEQVLGDQALRDELIARGHKQAGVYRWEQVADQTMAVYARCGLAGSGVEPGANG